MKQLAFIFDQRSCTGCHTCRIACRDAHDLGPGRDYRRVWETQGGSYRREGAAIVPEIHAEWHTLSCLHCPDPPCLDACAAGAISKRDEDGVVLIDPDLCVGCRSCAPACPSGAISFGSDGTAGKCDFCVSELDRGAPPVCVAACPMRALDWGPR